MDKELQNLTQLEFHILSAILKGCETISQIRREVRNYISQNNLKSGWSNSSFDHSLRKLVRHRYITKFFNEDEVMAKGNIYQINSAYKDKIKQYVELFYELNKGL